MGSLLAKLRGDYVSPDEHAFIVEVLYRREDREVSVGRLVEVGEVSAAIRTSTGTWSFTGGYLTGDGFTRVEVNVNAAKTARMIASALRARGFDVREIARALNVIHEAPDLDPHQVTRGDHGVTKVLLDQQDIFV